MLELNGHSPAQFFLQPVPRISQINVEVAAIDLCLRALEQKEVVATAAQAAEWIIEHGDAWRALCREIILCGERLHALEDRALKIRQAQGYTVHGLDLAEFIGTGRTLLGCNWINDPISRVRTTALAAKIITERDLKEARNA